jgi:SAM-dependent methyltransferase
MPAGFPLELIGLVLCPKDGGALAAAGVAHVKHLEAGLVHCTKCGASYEIRDGILRMLPGQEPLDPLSTEEQSQRDLAAGRYDAHFSEWANFTEVSAVVREKSLFAGKVILDLACGTGRVTTRLLPHARAIVAADLSEESLRVLARKAGQGASVGLVWADATQLRVAPESIDLALSTQLLEHIPTADKRAAFLQGVHSALAASGVLLLTVYYYSTLRRVLRRPQEGHHANGIYYRRFSREEIKKELAGLFRICAMRPIQIDPRLLPSSLPASHWLAENLEKTAMRDLIGQLLFVEASKTSAAFVAR